ncbi:MAG: hypothetical protein KDK51_04260, partial [Deltaproteobacteria bacterium]|nr:hypothetical protein [Deltaproteobacteria bacterium]
MMIALVADTEKEFFQNKLEQRVRVIQVVRFFIATAFLLGGIIFQPENAWQSQMFSMFIYASLGYFLYASLLTFLYLFDLVDVSTSYMIVQISFDFFFFTLFILFTAGVDSQLKYLYWLLIFYTGIIFDLEGAVLSAVITGFLFALLANIHFFINHIESLGFLQSLIVSEERIRVTSVITNCFGFILFGTVSAMIGRILNRADFETFSKVQEVEVLEQKIQKSEKFVEMGHMAAKIAHEIRNPLTSISASIEMLKSDFQVPEKKDQLLKIASKEVKRLNVLIEDFLHFAKPEESPFKPTLLSKVLSETVTIFQNGHPDIMMDCQLTVPHEKMVDLDEDKIHQLFWNVLNNAADAMDGHGRINVDFQETTPNRYTVMIKDQGQGVAEGIKNAFEPFITTKE